MMSKFNDLCHVYSTARRNYFDYWNSCADFATELLRGLGDYLECPKNNLSFVPLKENPVYGKHYNAKESMHLEQDTFWYVGMMFTLCPDESGEPEETIFLPVLIKQSDSEFTVKLGPQGEPLQIIPGNQEHYTHFFDHVYAQINSVYEDRLHKFLEREPSSRRIGFAPE